MHANDRKACPQIPVFSVFVVFMNIAKNIFTAANMAILKPENKILKKHAQLPATFLCVLQPC
jgi:hypothetical protein